MVGTGRGGQALPRPARGAGGERAALAPGEGALAAPATRSTASTHGRQGRARGLRRGAAAGRSRDPRATATATGSSAATSRRSAFASFRRCSTFGLLGRRRVGTLASFRFPPDVRVPGPKEVEQAVALLSGGLGPARGPEAPCALTLRIRGGGAPRKRIRSGARARGRP